MPTIDRRGFLWQSGMAGGALMASSLVGSDVFAAEAAEKTTLTILHTNDVHSRLEPFPMDGGKNAGMGGVAARAAIIEQIRAEAEHVLLLDAGDIFQGTPYFNIYKGEPEIKAMSMMGYDACTIGNHDFDAGLENFALQLKHATFPVLVCNYDFANTPMENKSTPFKIFEKGGIKIGVFGVGIELKGLVPEQLYGNTVYKDPIACANTTIDFLKRHGCDLIICLSHLGDKYDDNKVSDEVLAKETEGIDLIIGGHTHRFFPMPLKYTNKIGGDTLVNQVGWAGLQLGRLDYSFTKKNKKNFLKANTVLIEGKT
ncbi:bifunctional metallophosphatase/5'-nucleotidase [Parasediminibacterium sp. JCM 36343]|uniref:bifunctional metallophosphatase/5'-nucleotidase n=1 Tax=Parasediminibacterium sp. JCM 36343 TaxID=3374279 RepID=UPI00397BC4FB